MRVMKQWNMFTRELLDPPSLETFKAGALRNLIKLKMFLLIAVGVGLDDL